MMVLFMYIDETVNFMNKTDILNDRYVQVPKYGL